MAEEHKQQSSSSRKSRRERVEYARSRDILDVANEMNMELVRSGRDYRWKEHDSMVISPDKNMWNWFSRHQGGDVISLVETMKEVNFNQAIDYLNDGSFKEYTSVERVQEPFFYYLEPYEQPFEAARTYLKEQRGLSDETIDFFLEKGVLTQANAKVNGSIEPVVVFKSFDFAGEIVGATLQGIEENWEKWPERGYAKNIVRNSDGITGLHVDIGQPNRLIFAESAIDLMSYYELHKDSLQDVRLVSMDGLKEAIVGRHLTQLQAEIKGRPLRWTHDQLAEGLQTAIDNNFFTDGKHADWITLAVDNDEGGRNFIDSLREKGATINEDLPDLQSGQDKTDWNDVLKQHSNLELSDNNKEPDQTRNEEQDVLFENLANMTSSPTPETYEMILQQLRNETVIIAPEVVEEVAEEKTLMSEKADFSAEKTEKPLDDYQGQDVSEQQKNERTYQRKGSLQPEAEGSTSPVLETSTFERSVTSRPTVSSQYLNFTIKDGFKSRKTKYEKSIDAYNLGKLNRRGVDIQEAAQFYLNELANSTVHYFTSDSSLVQVNFLEENFLHLTGLKIIGDAATPEKVLHDFANGGELSYDDIRLKNTESPFDKIKVLPDLETVLQTDSFYFDDLQDIPRYQGRFDSLIKSDDSDLMLLFRMNTEDGTVPVSVFKARQVLKAELKEARKNEILGIYRERDGVLEQIAINEDYVKDGGKEFEEILKNKDFEPIQEETLEEKEVPTQVVRDSDADRISYDPSHDLTLSPVEALIDAATFTKVLDTAYNVGNPVELGISIPEEFQETWKHYNQLSEESSGDFKTIVAKADDLGLLDKTSAFYKDWQQDQIYNDSYHVRFQWAETWPDGPQIPFEETELVEYQTFAGVLYRENKALYERHHGSVAEVIEIGNQDAYIPITKVKFDVYAPGGTLIKSDVRYDVGDETEPISRLLGLGYRRLEGQPELAAIDEKILSQLENQEINQDIATEANEQVVTSQEIPESTSREDFQSPKQDIRTGLAQRVQEPNHRTQENISSSGPFDYTTASAYDISERAFQKIREYTQSPEDLMEYVEFMSKFPQLSPRNVALIQEQWRGANAVATYDQWKSIGEALGIKPEDLIQTKATYVNKRTGETKEVVHQGLSVKTGEKSQITLFRPLMVRMIPVIDENGNHVKNDKGNPKYKKFSDATPQEKELVKEGKLPVRQFQERDPKTGQPRFTTYKVFELSQTTLKPESYPKAMPNRHYNFDIDKVKTKEVLEGLCDYAESIGVSIMKDEAHVLGNAKGAFFPGEQIILLNPDNTPGEKIATTIHELAHATLHNPKFSDQYKELPKVQKELEAEMTSHLLTKYFGLDTSEKAIDYMAQWTNNLQGLNDKQLTESLKRIHKTVSKMHKEIEHHTKPYQQGKNRGESPNFPKTPNKGLGR